MIKILEAQINKYSSAWRKALLFLLVALTAFSSNGLNAQDTLTLSLSEAIRLGLEQNYGIRISEKLVEISQNNNTQGIAGRYPSISFTATQGNSYDNSEARVTQEDRDKLTANFISPAVAVNWTLFDGFRVNITKKNLDALEELSMGNAAVIVENTIQGIILGYYNVLLQKEILDVFAEVKKLSGDRYLYMKTKQQFGSAVTFDVLQANDAYLSDSVNYLQQELNLQNASLLLKLLLALDENTYFVLNDEFAVEVNEYRLDTLTSKMLNNNKTLVNQYINQKIYQYSTSLARSQQYPALYLGAGADYNNLKAKYAGLSESSSYSFGYYANFTLSFNIFNGGKTKNDIQNSLINEDIGMITISELSKQLSNQMKTQFDLFEIRKKLLNVADASSESTGLNLKIAEEKFKTGAINSFNFRDIQLRYLNASIRKLEAIYNLIDTETELMRLTGGIITAY